MKSEIKFAIGEEVVSKKYGTGIVIASGYSRSGSVQYGIKFYNGGPQGWAEKSTHDPNDLVSFTVKGPVLVQ